MPNVDPTPESSLLSPEAAAFLDAVVCDGRYVFDVSERPIEVAQALDLDITPAAAEQVASRPLEQLAPALWESKFLAHDPNQMNSPAFVVLVTPVGPAIAIGVVIGVVVGVVVVRSKAKSAKFAIVDNSAHKNDKL